MAADGNQNVNSIKITKDVVETRGLGDFSMQEDKGSVVCSWAIYHRFDHSSFLSSAALSLTYLRAAVTANNL